MRIVGKRLAYSVFLAVAVLIANSLSTPIRSAEDTRAVGDNFYQIGRDGRYIMRYETPNGIVHYETGYLRYLPNGTPYQVKEGYYMYPTADGRMVRVSYFADHEGYRVTAYAIRDSSFDEHELKI